MTPEEIIVVFGRLQAQGLRNMPADQRAVAREWKKVLEPVEIHPDLLGDKLITTSKWWPTIPEVLAAIGELELPARKVGEHGCEDAWVEVQAWPRMRYRPCKICQPAAFNAWDAGELGWWDA